MSLTANMSTRKQPSLTEVVQAHTASLGPARLARAQMELEVRVPHSQYLIADWLNIWRGAYNRTLAQYQDWVAAETKESWITSVECSVRMIDGAGGVNRILQAEYTGSTLTRRLGITKQQVINTIYDGFKVSLSKETESSAEQFERMTPTLIRLRMRVSFQIPNLNDWRVDFTYVASTENQSAFNSFLTDIRKSFMPKGTLSPTNFMELIVQIPGAAPELEIEWIRKDRAPTEAEIQSGIRHLRQIVWETQSEGNEYSMVIRWMAKRLDRHLKDKSSLKQISNNPIGMSLNAYVNTVYPNLNDYYLTDKADGERAFLVLCPREQWPLTKAVDVEQKGKSGAAELTTDLAKLRLERRQLEDVVNGGVENRAVKESELVAKTRELMRADGTLDDAEDEVELVVEPPHARETKSVSEEDLNYLSSDEEPVFGAGGKPRVVAKSKASAKSKATPKSKAKESAYVSFLVTSTLTEVDVIRPAKVGDLEGVTIIDMEHIVGKNEGMFAFDILMYNDADVTEEPMSTRLEALGEVAAALKIEVKTQTRLDKDPQASIKKFIPAGKSEKSGKKKYHIDGLIFTHENSGYWKPDAVYKMKPPDRLTIDFLIMRAPVQMMNAAPYVPQPGYTMYLLFSGINQDKMRQFGISTADLPQYRELFQNFRGAGRIFPIHFTTLTHKLAYIYYHPSQGSGSEKKKLVLKDAVVKDELHRHVGEFIWTPSETKKAAKGEANMLPGMVPWVLVKLRADKDANVEDGLAYGNSYTTALDTFNDILHPLTYADLLKPPSPSDAKSDTSRSRESDAKPKDDTSRSREGEGDYFAKNKGQDYQPTTNFNNFAKAQPMQQLANVSTVVDLMCGKGQDLFKFIGYQVKALICIDKDSAALDELRNRFRNHINEPQWYTYPPMPVRPGINLNVMQYDMGKDLPALSKRLTTEHMLNNSMADGVVCNLGLHYIIGSEAEMKSFIQFLSATLRIGGKFIYTSFNGHRVFQMLGGLKKGEAWSSEKGKYSIRRDYAEKTLSYGLKIAVLHPFSNGELYEENLLPIEMMTGALAKAGYALIQQGSFQDFWGRYEQLGKGLAGRLSTEDRFYSSLYQYSTYVRVKE